MKKIILFLLGLCFSNALLNAQNNSNLVIFSDDGDPFYVYVNGIKQNSKPETNVKVTGLPENASVKIVFENKALPELKKLMALEPGFEHTARIKRDMKKQLKLQYFGQVPLAEAHTEAPTVSYHVSEDGGQGGTNSNTVTTQNNGFNTNAQVNVRGDNNNDQTTVTSSTTTVSQGSRKGNGNNSENVNVNVNMAGVGFNMSVSGTETEGGADGEQVTTTTTTSKTVTTTRNSSTNTTVQNTEPAPVNTQPAPASNNSRAGCSVAMAPGSFAKMKQNVESKPFSDTKMSTAKIATKSACLSPGQVKEICKLFSMDEDKLEYAKYAYDYCVDKSSYYEVSEVFSFSSTTDEFNKFLEGK